MKRPPADRVTRSGTGNRLAQTSVLPARSIEQRGLVTVVGSATKLDVVDGRLSACTVRNDMVELEEAAFAAAAPVGGDEGAAALIALRDRPCDVRGNVPGVLGLATALAAPFRGRELAALEIGDQERE